MKHEVAMYSISYGGDVSIAEINRGSAREALEVAEEYLAANRTHVIVTDLATMRHVSLEELREIAEAEADKDPPRS